MLGRKEGKGREGMRPLRRERPLLRYPTWDGFSILHFTILRTSVPSLPFMDGMGWDQGAPPPLSLCCWGVWVYLTKSLESRHSSSATLF